MIRMLHKLHDWPVTRRFQGHFNIMDRSEPTLRADIRPAWQRYALMLAGIVALGLGVLGVVLPGLPTTPFVLLAAACFAKASPRWHAWLKNNRWFGPMVRDWEAHRSLPLKVKWLASAMMLAMVSLSAWSLRAPPGAVALLFGLALVGLLVVWRIPTRR